MVKRSAERLAGVLGVGQGVDDRHAGPLGQFFQSALSEGAHGDGVDVTAEYPGDIGDALALAQADFGGGKVHRLAAELFHRQFEADAGTQRGFLEDEGQGFAG